MKSKFLLLMASVALFLGSCSVPKDIIYMQEAETIPADVLKASAKINDPLITVGDILYINVTATNRDVVKPFNKTEYFPQTSLTQATSNENAMFYYLVDNEGYIDFPIIGRINVGNKKLSTVQEEIANYIYPKYIKEKPAVEVRFQNFHVYTMGEVARPGQVKASNGRITILEAISQSGDLTIYGRRDNVMLIHNNADGSREVVRVDLTDKNLIVSPNYYLRQNDMIYVEPNDSKQRSSWTIPPGWSFGTSIVSVCLSLATFIITLTK